MSARQAGDNRQRPVVSCFIFTTVDYFSLEISLPFTAGRRYTLIMMMMMITFGFINKATTTGVSREKKEKVNREIKVVFFLFLLDYVIKIFNAYRKTHRPFSNLDLRVFRIRRIRYS